MMKRAGRVLNRRAAWGVVLGAALAAGCGGSKPTIYTVLRNWQQDNFPKVVEECQVLLANDPADVQAYRFLIKASKQLGTLDALRQEYEQRVEAEPSNAVAHFAVGYAHVQRREFAAAMVELNKATELDPQIEYANYVIGWIYFNPLSYMYDVEAGRAAWMKETALNPGSLGALQVYRDLGGYHEGRGEFESAREQMRAFRDHAFSEGDRIAARDLLERLKQHELEVVQMQQRADDPEADTPTLLEYARNLYKWQRQSDAMPYWDRVLELQPDNAEIHNFVGMAHMELGQNEDAIVSFNRSLEFQPEFAEPHHNLGMLYDTLGDAEQALVHFERYLELQPFSQQAEVLRVRVDELRVESTAAQEATG